MNPALRQAPAEVNTVEDNAAPVIEIAVADSGIGIRKSLAKNTELAGIESDCAAIKLAMIEGTTSVGDKYRGLGLAYVVDQVQLQRQRSMVIRSSNGIITRSGDGVIREEHTPSAYPGTVISITIPL